MFRFGSLPCYSGCGHWTCSDIALVRNLLLYNSTIIIGNTINIFSAWLVLKHAISINLVSWSETRWLSKYESIHRFLKLTQNDHTIIRQQLSESSSLQSFETALNARPLLEYYVNTIKPLHMSIVQFEVNRILIYTTIIKSESEPTINGHGGAKLEKVVQIHNYYRYMNSSDNWHSNV